MKRRRKYVLVQLLLIGLCSIALLFSMFRERVIVRHVIQRYELPYLGTTLLRTIDGLTSDDLVHELRAFEDSNSVLVYILAENGLLLYPETVTDAISEQILTARMKIFDQVRGPLYETTGQNAPLLWGSLDRKSGNTVIIAFSRMRILDMYRQESRRLTTVFFTLFFLLAAGSFLIVRYVFRSMERELQWNRERFTRLQAIAEAQASRVKNAQTLIHRCGTALRERNSPDPVAEDLCEYSTFIEQSMDSLGSLLDPDGNVVNPGPVHLHGICTRVQGLVADEFSGSGVALALSELDSGLYVHGQEILLVVALEDLLLKMLPYVEQNSKIGLTISGTADRVWLDMAVPVKESLVHPAGLFLSGFLFELLGIRIGCLMNEHRELIIHTEFQGSGV